MLLITELCYMSVVGLQCWERQYWWVFSSSLSYGKQTKPEVSLEIETKWSFSQWSGHQCDI